MTTARPSWDDYAAWGRQKNADARRQANAEAWATIAARARLEAHERRFRLPLLRAAAAAFDAAIGDGWGDLAEVPQADRVDAIFDLLVLQVHGEHPRPRPIVWNDSILARWAPDAPACQLREAA